ncbi:MAG: PQQ-binding-like beta-propeller repeat protein [Ignavibacteria bacterium]|nr:PQQ-binding-like beta-propeller repeat protein [Ignavibacteria bacterium]
MTIGTGGNNELVYALSGRTGKLIWSYGDSLITSDGDINGLSVLKDYNNDGKKDILAAATGEGKGTGRHAVICLNAVNGNVIFYQVQNGEFTHSTTSTSIGGAIDFSFNGGPYGINGFNNSGSQIWTFPTASSVWNLKELQDLNTDAVTDIASFIGFNGTITTLSGSNGQSLWSLNLGSSIDGNIRLMDDISGDGFLDIVSSGPRNLSRIESRLGGILWTSVLDGNYIHGVCELSDLTGNGIKEIVAGTQNSNLYVVNGDSGRILFTYNFGSATTNTVEQVSGLKSIDGNISAEFLGGSRTGKVICFSGGPNGIVGISNASSIVPEKFSLYQNYPNPFNPVTKIKFDVPRDARGETQDVKLVIFDVLGKEVMTLVNEKLSPGSYEADFEGSNFASGIYFYKIEAGSFVETKRMMLLK